MGTEDRLEVATGEELDAWLAATDRTESIWLVTHKKHHADYVTYDEIVEALLIHGWIDSQARALDEDRSMRLISPRRPASIWSRRNKEIVARLEAGGRMRPAGRAVIERAKADGSWTVLDDVEALIVPDDLAAALDDRGARDTWNGFPPSIRKQHLWMVKSAKRAGTRADRIERIATDAAAGRRT